MIKVMVNGAHGKMGAETVKAVRAEKDLQLVAETDMGDNLTTVIEKNQPQVVVDFTNPSSVLMNVRTILQAGCAAVVGTTGLSEKDLADLDQLAKDKKLGLMVCPNFAIGALLMMQLAAQAAKFLPDVEIIEMHHNQKADAPSGTAIKTAELIMAANPQVNSFLNPETEIIPKVRGGRKGAIPIHSVRLPGYVAHQEVILGGMGQTLTIRHDSIARTSFMPGVMLAIRKVVELPPGLVYGLEKVLF